jgi:hypothetical protein
MALVIQTFYAQQLFVCSVVLLPSVSSSMKL